MSTVAVQLLWQNSTCFPSRLILSTLLLKFPTLRLPIHAVSMVEVLLESTNHRFCTLPEFVDNITLPQHYLIHPQNCSTYKPPLNHLMWVSLDCFILCLKHFASLYILTLVADGGLSTWLQWFGSYD